MKKRIRLTEGDLRRIVNESVNRVLYNEGVWQNFKNKVGGASLGWKQGGDYVQQNDQDADEMAMWVDSAKRVLATKDPNQAMQFVQNLVNKYSQHKEWQKEWYGNNLNHQ